MVDWLEQTHLFVTKVSPASGLVWFGNPLIIMFVIVITSVILTVLMGPSSLRRCVLSKLMNEINEDKGDEGIYENEDDDGERIHYYDDDRDAR